MSEVQNVGGQQVEEAQVGVLSKSQLKRQKRKQKWLDSRAERRKLERAKRKEKRKSLAQDVKDGKSVSTYRRPTLMADSANKFKIVIDMDFEDYMTESEISKAVQQVGRIYAANRHSENPCQLYVTSLKGKILDKFASTNTGYINWDINHTDKDYLELFKATNLGMSKFVYLTGDAEATLPEASSMLKDDSRIYIIGGLVDHNRHKNLCLTRARERGVPTAKLPVKEHVTLTQRHILSTLTVFEILHNVLGSRKSWPEALTSSIPKRKMAQADKPQESC